jgi:hypothetical protein
MIGSILTLITITGSITGATITGMVITEMIYVIMDALS